jgi:hypothetical protein
MTFRRHCTLNEKIQLINDSNSGNGTSQRKLAEKYNIQLDFVSNILKCRKEYFHNYQTKYDRNIKRKSKVLLR